MYGAFDQGGESRNTQASSLPIPGSSLFASQVVVGRGSRREELSPAPGKGGEIKAKSMHTDGGSGMPRCSLGAGCVFFKMQKAKWSEAHYTDYHCQSQAVTVIYTHTHYSQ